ncbi:MAG: hypothetical protein H0W18_03070, partial [Acidobacteria bacterium]|nr:hypothetical protein [Acidobacteriota bacterium]
DEGSPSDWLRVVIDSFHDRRSGYEFAVNPAGVKQDSYWFNDGDRLFSGGNFNAHAVFVNHWSSGLRKTTTITCSAVSASEPSGSPRGSTTP